VRQPRYASGLRDLAWPEDVATPAPPVRRPALVVRLGAGALEVVRCDCPTCRRAA